MSSYALRASYTTPDGTLSIKQVYEGGGFSATISVYTLDCDTNIQEHPGENCVTISDVPASGVNNSGKLRKTSLDADHTELYIDAVESSFSGLSGLVQWLKDRRSHGCSLVTGGSSGNFTGDATSIQNSPVSASSPDEEDIFRFKSGEWVPEPDGSVREADLANPNQVKSFNSSDYATAAQGGLADSAQQPPSEGAFVDGDKDKLDNIEPGADVTDEANVVSALNGATLTDVGTPASTDRVLLQDASDTNNLKYADFSEFGGGASFPTDDTNLNALNVGGTFTNYRDFRNATSSIGLVNGGSVTDAGSGTVDVSGGTASIRSGTGQLDNIYFVDFPASAGLALTDNAQNFIYVGYNGGTPAITVSLAPTPTPDHMILGIVYRAGNDLYISDLGYPTAQAVQQVAKRFTFTKGLERQNGSVTSEVGTRQLSITSGKFWIGLTEHTIPALDTSAADTFSYWYYDGSAWVEVASSTTIDNTQYNDISSGLATLANNQYGIHWVYRSINGDTHIVYGQDSYTLTQAENAETPPTLPPFITGVYTSLVAKLVIEKNSNTITDIQNPFNQDFASGVASNHSDLAGLGDDDHTQYPLISQSTSPPVTTPTRVGLIHVDTAAADLYVSTGTSASSDWTLSSVSSRYFISDTDLSPSISGQPSISEVTSSVSSVSGNKLLYYTGTDTSSDTPTYVYWLDTSGVVTQLDEPGVEIDLTGIAEGELLVWSPAETKFVRNPSVNNDSAAADILLHSTGAKSWFGVGAHRTESTLNVDDTKIVLKAEASIISNTGSGFPTFTSTSSNATFLIFGDTSSYDDTAPNRIDLEVVDSTSSAPVIIVTYAGAGSSSGGGGSLTVPWVEETGFPSSVSYTGTASSSVLSDGTMDLYGGGADISGSGDQAIFWYSPTFVSLNTTYQIIGASATEVISGTWNNGAGPYLAIRADESDESAKMCVVGTNPGNPRFQQKRRTSQGGGVSETNDSPGGDYDSNFGLRLVVDGTGQITSFYSQDGGSTWTSIGVTYTDLTAEITAGTARFGFIMDSHESDASKMTRIQGTFQII